MKDSPATIMKQTVPTAVVNKRLAVDGELRDCKTPPLKKRKIIAQATQRPVAQVTLTERSASATSREDAGEDERDERPESPRDYDGVHLPPSPAIVRQKNGQPTMEEGYDFSVLAQNPPTEERELFNGKEAETPLVVAPACKLTAAADKDADGLVLKGGRLRLPDKLMEYLNKNVVPKTLWWMPDGVSFALDTSTAQEELLDPYFHGTKLSSFLRSLNRWGFKRIFYHSLPKNTFSFHHHMFSREDPAMELEMKMYSREPGPERTVPVTAQASAAAHEPRAALTIAAALLPASKYAAVPEQINRVPAVAAAASREAAAAPPRRDPAPAAGVAVAPTGPSSMAPTAQALLEALLGVGSNNNTPSAAPAEQRMAHPAIPHQQPSQRQQPRPALSISPQALLETLLRHQAGRTANAAASQTQRQIPQQIVVPAAPPNNNNNNLAPSGLAAAMAQSPQSILEKLLRGQRQHPQAQGQQQQQNPHHQLQQQLQRMVAQQHAQQQTEQVQQLLQTARDSALVRDQNQELVQLVMLLTSALRR